MKSKPFLALLLSVCVLLPALAQTKPATTTQPQKPANDKDDDVVRITTNLVQIDAVVTKDGKVVPNLTADDFEIYEDGRKQVITSFAFVSNVTTAPTQPLSPKAKGKTTDAVPFIPLKREDPRRIIAFVVDDLGLSAESMSQVRKQLRKFITEQLQPNDLIAIIRTGSELGALQQFTNDRRLLSRAVDRLRWNICSRAGTSVLPRFTSDRFEMDPEFNCGGNYGNTMNAMRSTLDALAQLPGRKSMVVLSDSMPIEDQELIIDGQARPYAVRNYSFWLQKIAEKAIRSSVVIYSVDTQGLQYTGLTAADSIPMTRANMNTITNQIMSSRSNLMFRRRQGGDLIAKQTGGFQIRNSNSFELDRIVQDQSGYYLLGYRPTDETFNRRFHHIKAKVKRSGMSIRTRFGFFGVSEEEATPMQRIYRNPTNLALMSPFREQDIEINLTSFFVHDKAAGSTVRSFIYIDPKGMTLDAVNGRRQGEMELHGALFGDNGFVAEQLSSKVTLNISESNYEQAMRNGMVLPIDMPVKRPGSYQVRIVARDKATAKIGSAGQFVDVPDLRKKRVAVSGIILGKAPETSSQDVEQTIQRPGARSFEPNSNLHFVFMMYNAAGAGSLVMEAKLFRDGKVVYSGPEVPIAFGNQPDLNRLLVHGTAPLSADLEVGDYYLQVVITDNSSKKKTALAVQWMDFEIVK